MKTIGKVLQDSRHSKNLSLGDLEKATKIKAVFIKAIESESWTKLPEYPVVLGFVKSLAGTLEIDREQAIALLRRDYPPRSRTITQSPKPDIKEKFTWSPKLTFFTGVAFVLVLMVSYLTIQYINYIKPPVLVVSTPSENQQVESVRLLVSGQTDPEATVVVNNQPAIVEEDGNFTAEIEIFQGTQEILIVAKTRSGKETIVRRKIEPQLGT